MEFEKIEKDIESLESEKFKLTELLSIPNISSDDLMNYAGRLSEVISELEKKLCLFQKVPFSALFCVVFGFFHLLGRGDPPDPKYYNKF